MVAGLSAEAEAKRSQIEAWPHGQSFLFASLGVVLGMFSVNRFVILTLDFGGETDAQNLVMGRYSSKYRRDCRTNKTFWSKIGSF